MIQGIDLWYADCKLLPEVQLFFQYSTNLRGYGMNRLHTDTFFSGAYDVETKQYEVLNGIKAYTSEFQHNRLYPALSELIELYGALQDFLNKKNDFKLPQNLKDVDLDHKQLIFEQGEVANSDLERAVDLIAWAIPRLKQCLDEGREVYNFVDEHIQIEEVGIMPMYKEEGYWFVPEHTSSLMHLIRYQVSLFSSTSERYRSLKTQILESIAQANIHPTHESLKLDLIGKYHDLPNPATYACETDLEFPFLATILPVAKRKLMNHLFS